MSIITSLRVGEISSGTIGRLHSMFKNYSSSDISGQFYNNEKPTGLIGIRYKEAPVENIVLIDGGDVCFFKNGSIHPAPTGYGCGNSDILVFRAHYSVIGYCFNKKMTE